ncbi:MAG: 50S ribosomal protein L5, partial [gamma proteobacterium symbiont of Stewartia floridana]
MARLQQYYSETVIKDLMDKFQFDSIMEVPKITKITLN